MWVCEIDTAVRSAEIAGGLAGFFGSEVVTADEKRRCVGVVARYALDGWAIAGDPDTVIGHLAALTAHAAGAPFVALRTQAPETDGMDAPGGAAARNLPAEVAR